MSNKECEHDDHAPVARFDRLHLLQELQGTTCQCGSTKNEKQTFCSKCYYSLPKEMRRALYRRFGQGYEKAYERAFVLLTRKAGAAPSEGVDQ